MVSTPTNQEVSSYLLRVDAVCPCWIKDILQRLSPLSGNTFEGEAWSLGTTPSRQFKIAGIVVGIDEYENPDSFRTVHIIDDGTATIKVMSFTKKPRPVRDVYWPPKGLGKRPEQLRVQPPQRFEVGTLLGVVGIVEKFRDTRQMKAVRMEPLWDVMAESEHWEEVAHANATKYSQPFVIPPLPQLPTTLVVPPPPEKPTQERSLSQEPTQTDIASTSNFVEHNIHSIELAGTPKKVTRSTAVSAPLHPALLRSGDLSAKTFEHYVHYYMEHEPCRPQSCTSRTVLRDSLEFNGITPVSQRTRPIYLNDAPKANPLKMSPENEGDFTLNYLRHAPDLRYLARRVVLAEHKRRERKARHLAKEKEALEDKDKSLRHSQLGSGSVRSTSSSSSSKVALPKPLTGTSIASKMKKLFEMTIRNMHQDGQIITTSGTNPRRWPTDYTRVEQQSSQTSDQALFDTFVVWRDPPLEAPSLSLNSTTSSFDTNLSTLSSTHSSRSSRSSRHEIPYTDQANEPLSDPSDTEYTHNETYALVTPKRIAPLLPRAIRAFNHARMGASGYDRIRETVRAQKYGVGVKDITARLRNLEGGIWERVSEMAVLDGLKECYDRGTVWEPAEGLWATLE